MHVGAAWFTKPSTDHLAGVLERATAQEPTFAGTDVTAAVPKGFHHDRWERVLARPVDDAAFARVGAAILRFQAQLGSGFAVAPAGAVAGVGLDVAVLASLGPKGLPPHIVALCRVVVVEEEPDRIAFTYATLPTHPEDGIERFAIERRADGSAVLVVEAISRSASALARAIGPIANRLQGRAAQGYLDALEATLAT